MSNKPKNQCQNCNYFDNSKHKNDERTKTAGVCKKWYDIVFLTTPSCKEYIDEKMTNEIFVFEPLNFQLDLFK